jgi:hypothetical protein
MIVVVEENSGGFVLSAASGAMTTPQAELDGTEKLSGPRGEVQTPDSDTQLITSAFAGLRGLTELFEDLQGHFTRARLEAPVADEIVATIESELAEVKAALSNMSHSIREDLAQLRADADAGDQAAYLLLEDVRADVATLKPPRGAGRAMRLALKSILVVVGGVVGNAAWALVVRDGERMLKELSQWVGR